MELESMKFNIHKFKPFLPIVEFVQHCMAKISNLKLERINEKISFARRVYETVEDKSLYRL